MTRGPCAGIVQEDFVALEALEDDEVVEIPEQDDRELEVVQLVELLVLEALRIEPVVARGLEHVVRLAAVARDAALVAQFFERRPSGRGARGWRPSAAAPHSTASICRMVGVFCRLGGRGGVAGDFCSTAR